MALPLRKFQTVCCLLTGLFCFIPTENLRAEPELFTVLANKEGAPKELKTSELKQIFLGDRIYWPEGHRIFPATLDTQSSSFSSFSETVLNMAPDQYLSTWRRTLFVGRGTPPRRFSSESDLINYLARTHGSIAVASQKPSISTPESMTIRVLR